MVAFNRIGRLAGGGCLLALAACGARTGELDGTEYTTRSSLPSDGGAGTGGNGATTSSAGSSTRPGAGGTSGAAGSIGSGATSGMFGQAGATTGGSSGVTDATQAACKTLCMDPQASCPDLFGPPGQCFKDCVQGLQVENGACEEGGIEMALCIAKVIKSYGKDCVTGQAQAQVLCASWLSSYQSCAAGNSTGTGSPPPSDCVGNVSADLAQCFESLTCSVGPSYSVTCTLVTANQSTCQCEIGNVTANLTLNESPIYACTDALSACGGPIVPK